MQLKLNLSDTYKLIGDPLTVNDYIYELSRLDAIHDNDPEKYFIKYVGIDLLGLKRLYESHFENLALR